MVVWKEAVIFAAFKHTYFGERLLPLTIRWRYFYTLTITHNGIVPPWCGYNGAPARRKVCLNNGKGNAVFLLPVSFINVQMMKESNNGALGLKEQGGLSALIKAAQQLFGISNEIETVISGGKFEGGVFDDELFRLADTLRQNANTLAPIIGSVAIGSTL